jgi:putative transposase
MGNHFHLLLEVPERETLPPLDEEGLLEVLPLLYDNATVAGVTQELERARKADDHAWHQEILGRYERRRGDLSQFVGELKQRVTLYMNKRLEREGTLWEGRFKSVLVEDGEAALLTVAAYIDLNPVRAGLVPKPEDYRWSGYGEAVGGGPQAKQSREGLARVLGAARSDEGSDRDWELTLSRYRVLLYDEGREVMGDDQLGEPGRRGMKEKVVEAMIDSGGRMPLAEALRHRVRYFRDGAVIGSADFVEAIFEREKAKGERFGKTRKTGARRMRGADWGELRVLRDLQKDVMGT